MEFCQKSIEEAILILTGGRLQYEDVIILGENSSGKSLMLKLLIQQLLQNECVYFVDAVNRVLAVQDIPRNPEHPEYSDKIVETRIRDDYFNIKDSFNCYGTSTERAERIYHLYETRVQELFYELTGDCFEILHDDNFGHVKLKKGMGMLSSGYQAMTRLLLELVFYDEMAVKKRNLSYAWVVIDEIDEFLSPGFSAKIFPFLKKKFEKMRFVVSTHSIDVVMSASDTSLLILDDKGNEFLDANDYRTFTDTRRIFQRVFGKADIQTSYFDNVLRKLLNNKINNAWTEEDEEKLMGLKTEKLSSSQKLIFRQIMNWDE